MSDTIREQIQRVLDEDPGRRVGVIVQLSPDADNQAAGVEGARRSQATGAREMLPEPARANRSAAVLAGATEGGVPRVRPPVPDLAGAQPAPPTLSALR